MLPPPTRAVAKDGHAMIAPRVLRENDTAHGWSHQVEIQTQAGQARTLTVQLSYQDYEYWSGGSRPPEQVTLALVECLLEPGPDSNVPSPLPDTFDASTARRWLPDLDNRLRAGSWH